MSEEERSVRVTDHSQIHSLFLAKTDDQEGRSNALALLIDTALTVRENL
jgi:hypothetical protein